MKNHKIDCQCSVCKNIRKECTGKNHPCFKDGRTLKNKNGEPFNTYGILWIEKEKIRKRKWYLNNKNLLLLELKNKRHSTGISKKFNTGITHIKGYKKYRRKIYKYNRKNAGKLSIKTIQQVYEDNIKKYGTLTCYLCLKPIRFGEDSLEHKIPLSRKGTNEYDNLDIAHLSCNIKKHNKTETEYKQQLTKEKKIC